MSEKKTYAELIAGLPANGTREFLSAGVAAMVGCTQSEVEQFVYERQRPVTSEGRLIAELRGHLMRKYYTVKEERE